MKVSATSRLLKGVLQTNNFAKCMIFRAHDIFSSLGCSKCKIDNLLFSHIHEAKPFIQVVSSEFDTDSLSCECVLVSILVLCRFSNDYTKGTDSEVRT